MIVRVWRGVAPQCKTSDHVTYIQQELLQSYLKAPGNLGALLLSRGASDRAEFLVLSFWDSAGSLQALTGPDMDGALTRELVNPSPVVKNYKVVAYHLPGG